MLCPVDLLIDVEGDEENEIQLDSIMLILSAENQFTNSTRFLYTLYCLDRNCIISYCGTRKNISGTQILAKS